MPDDGQLRAWQRRHPSTGHDDAQGQPAGRLWHLVELADDERAAPVGLKPQPGWRRSRNVPRQGYGC